jgi:hypothetical protein
MCNEGSLALPSSFSRLPQGALSRRKSHNLLAVAGWRIHERFQ